MTPTQVLMVSIPGAALENMITTSIKPSETSEAWSLKEVQKWSRCYGSSVIILLLDGGHLRTPTVYTLFVSLTVKSSLKKAVVCLWAETKAECWTTPLISSSACLNASVWTTGPRALRLRSKATAGLHQQVTAEAMKSTAGEPPTWAEHVLLPSLWTPTRLNTVINPF